MPRPAVAAVTAVAVCVALSALALGLFAGLKHPEPMTMGDAAAPGVAGVAIGPPMREPLARHLARNPRDGRGWVLFARIEFAADRFAAAAEAYRNALDASPKVARDPGIWCEYADALAMVQGGVLAGRPDGRLLLHPWRPLPFEPAGPESAEDRQRERRELALGRELTN